MTAPGTDTVGGNPTMNIIHALTLCRDDGRRARPVCWREINPSHWIIFRSGIFLEHGEREEMPHALRLMRPEEFLGEWEIVEPLPPADPE
jgi:hypothetical protein